LKLPNIIEGLRILLTPLDALNWLRVEKQARIKKNEWALLLNVHIGEAYYICGLIEAFRKEHNNDPVVIVIPKRYLAITKLFPRISRVVVAGKLPIPFTYGFVSLRKPRKGILLLPLGPMLYNYKGVNFLDSFKIGLHLKPTAKFSKPLQQSHKSILKAKRMLLSSGLKPGSTIIIFPNALSTISLPKESWVRLVKGIKSRGFSVATSVTGNESGIPGSVPLHFSLDEAHSIVQAAGWFVAIRSGICDFLSSANCKKTILYPKYSDYYHIGEFNENINKFRMIKNLSLPNTKNIQEYEVNPVLSRSEISKILS
jgi:hypothetical protein